MNMIIDMVDAVAVIALAAGAEAEFQIGVVRIGAAANLTLAGIRLGLHFVVDTADLVFIIF